ncbi:hypothetical protein CDAR_180181 [Caerostris darwini]|uniref:Uncharacterized protein n=1 Tax=Caerostris darwini TaxID=1538125 RepID=A0AAV4PEJ0_9ARAC|nr:hypothetical protein CDAR_180181 [Caerostris darwini]
MGGAFVPLPANDGHCHEIESLSFITIQRGLKLMLSNSFWGQQTQTDLLGDSVTNSASGKKYRQRAFSGTENSISLNDSGRLLQVPIELTTNLSVVSMGGAFVPLPANDGHCHEIESLSFITIQRGLKLMLSNSFGCEQTQTDLLGDSVTNGASGKKYRQRAVSDMANSISLSDSERLLQVTIELTTNLSVVSMGGAFVPLPANDGLCHEIESLSFITIQRGLKLMLSNTF